MKWIFIDEQKNPIDPEKHLDMAIEDLEILLEVLKETRDFIKN